MEKLTLYFTPSQMAHIRDIPISEIFKEIRHGKLEDMMTDEGIKIPVTYCIKTN